jgi:hypothetical protein
VEPAPSADGSAGDGALQLAADVLDPVLAPLGFASGQVGATGGRGQVIFCRGVLDSEDGGCVDLVLDVEAVPDWRVVDVRYWGFPSDRWHLPFDRGVPFPDQLRDLARSLPDVLAS